MGQRLVSLYRLTHPLKRDYLPVWRCFPNHSQMFLKGIYWDFLEKFLNQGIGLLVSVILARILTPEDFGLIGMVMAIVSFAQVFIDMGFSTALVQKQDISEEQYATVFYLNIGIGIFLTVLVFSLSGVISAFYKEPILSPLVKGISPLFLINSLTLIQTAKYLKEINLKPLTIYRGVAVTISGIVGIGMAYSNFGVWSLVGQVLLNAIAFTLLVWLLSPWRPMRYFNLASIGALWNYGSKIFLPSLIENLFSRLDVFIIGKLFSAHSLGYYTRAQSLNNIVIQYSSASLTRVFFSVVSKHQQDTGRVVEVYQNALIAVSFLAFGLMGILFVSAENIILLLFTEKWVASIDYFRIMLLSAYAYPLSSIMVNVISGRGNSSAFLRLDILKKTLLLLVFIIGFQISIKAFLYGFALFSFLSVLLNMYFVSREIQLSMMKQLGMVLPYLLVAIISGVSAALLQAYLPLPRVLQFLVEAGTVAIVYLLLNLLLNTKAFRLLKGKFMRSTDKP
ncbi:lipopolysaccharide biosynthesis protein [Rufibacter immobilis]|uniref:lipopolysaccharide biosynthesis protein n=1 Tax=Rufibacter immobilis TaxID=1348778 RepID=UPI0035EA74C9